MNLQVKISTPIHTDITALLTFQSFYSYQPSCHKGLSVEKWIKWTHSDKKIFKYCYLLSLISLYEFHVTIAKHPMASNYALSNTCLFQHEIISICLVFCWYDVVKTNYLLKSGKELLTLSQYKSLPTTNIKTISALTMTKVHAHNMKFLIQNSKMGCLQLPLFDRTWKS